ncbi:HPr-rel-A system PqqD family peptide chaperone [Thioalkalivibrio sp. ALJ24]|uniref:HPr-rel-A system PqqD family peptide chaperone n=1 Tax=Thioalkalivibrio sp. ALJ24 TaxID=545276 RepID=UPI000A037F9C|nr:HPr-rel-A system PqqD family peptide chaperone [Thioalkalivibrio sp. ALJ24]
MVSGPDPAAPTGLWQTAALPAAHIREWAQRWVVYDHRTGETHLLEGAAGALFQWLHQTPRNQRELIEKCIQDWGHEVEDAEAFIEQLLAELRRRQLVWERS